MFVVVTHKSFLMWEKKKSDVGIMTFGMDKSLHCKVYVLNVNVLFNNFKKLALC